MMSEQEALSKLEAAKFTREQAKAVIEAIQERNPRAFRQRAATANEAKGGGTAKTPPGRVDEREFQNRIESLRLQALKFRHQRDLAFFMIMLAGTAIGATVVLWHLVF